MPYQPNKPLPPDDLDISVTDIQQNFLIANTVIDIDHYPFDNLTANKGFHKQVTSPDQGAAPAATANSQLFGWEQTANLGNIQYSKRAITAGDPNPVPSPITYIQSLAAGVLLTQAAPATTMFDFAGLSLAIMGIKVLVFDGVSGPSVSIFDSTAMWNGTVLAAFPIGNAIIDISSSGSLLQIQYTTQVPPLPDPITVFWTLIPYRLQ